MREIVGSFLQIWCPTSWLGSRLTIPSECSESRGDLRAGLLSPGALQDGRAIGYIPNAHRDFAEHARGRINREIDPSRFATSVGVGGFCRADPDSSRKQWRIGELYHRRCRIGRPCKKGPEWGPERTIRAEVIYALATVTQPQGSQSAWPVRAKGVTVTGARIIGRLDFSFAQIKSPLTLVSCHIESTLVLRSASAQEIDLNGSCLPGITASNLTVQSNLLLNNVSIKVKWLSNWPKIGAFLPAAAGNSRTRTATALIADGMTVGDVFLDQGFDGKGNTSADLSRPRVRCGWQAQKSRASLAATVGSLRSQAAALSMPLASQSAATFPLTEASRPRAR